MSKYILNKNKQDSPSGENYEVHNEDKCTSNHLPLSGNRIFVGYFDNCRDAVIKAKNDYPSWAKDIDGCYWCVSACHKE